MRKIREYSDLFFSSAFDEVDHTEILATEYVLYLSACVLINDTSAGKSLYSSISTYYPDGSLKKTPFIKAIQAKYPGGRVSNEEKQNILHSHNVAAKVSRLIAEGSKENYEKIIPSLMNHTFDEDILSSIYALDAIKTGKPVEYYGYKFYDLIQNKENHSKKIRDCIAGIHSSFLQRKVDDFVTDPIMLSTFTYMGCESVNDIVSLDVDVLMMATSLAYADFIADLEFMKDDFKNAFVKIMKAAIDSLNERDKEVIEYRNGFYGKETHTLEETGSVYGLTRERVRQIEVRGISKLTDSLKDHVSSFRYLYSLLAGDKGYLRYDEIEEYINDDQLIDFIMLVLGLLEDLEIEFNNKYRLCVDKANTSLEEIFILRLSKLDVVITKDDYQSLNDLDKMIVLENYTIKKGVYVRKGVNSTILLDRTIKQIFPDGYRVGSTEDFKKIMEAGRELYGDEFAYENEHSMASALDRAGYILIDKGLYKNKDDCSQLTTDLLAKIMDFISERMPIVFYSAIFEEYKNELLELGIDNHFYLKGVLDSNLPGDFQTKRDYISGEKGLTSQGAILKKMESYTEPFSLNDLRRAFPTTKDYIFNMVIYEHSEYLSLYSGRFIHYRNINLDEETKEKLKEVIDKALAVSSTSFVTDKKVFARLKLFNKNLLVKLKYIDSHFALFSLIQHLFSSDYYLKRPFISRDENAVLSADSIIMDYVGQMDEFDCKIVNDYSNKLNMRGLYSYLDFMETMSDEYVQVSIDRMVKKSAFNMQDETLEEIRNTVSTMIKYSGDIDTRKFKGYNMLPKIKYPWSKYLLVGIVRSFLDEFEVVNTDTFYNKTDFIIKTAGVVDTPPVTYTD